MRIYAVGGSVRDELLGRGAQDRDFVVLQASQEEFLARFPEAKQVGREHPVFIHQGREFTLSSSQHILDDLQERDLTVNALARDEGGRCIGLPQSLSDLKQGILRPVHRDNFFSDPLRAFRAARLAACLPQFSVHPELEEALQDLGRSSCLTGIAPERVGREATKACACARPGRFLRLLDDNGCLRAWFAPLAEAGHAARASSLRTDARPAGEAAAVMDRVAGDALTVWMGLCHVFASLRQDPGAVPAWCGKGASTAQRLGVSLRLPKRFIKAGEAAAGWITAACHYLRLPAALRVELLLGLQARRLVQPMARLVDAVAGVDLQDRLAGDLELVLSVKLPPEERGRGARSGRILHRLRSRALESTGGA
jgi:tRNA nucleotidyltransferase (CCA-adding enzyme)